MPGRRLLLVGLLAGLACARPAPAQDTASVEGTLRLASWRGAFLGRGADGQLGLLAGPDGSYRVEVAEGQAPLATLLDRQGRGWTLVLPARGEAIAQPWDREWRKLEADLGAGLRAIAAALADPDAPAGAGRRVVLPPPG
ncbi:MAG: hypothetical protein IH621_10340, partial [Krumholzibacteria bacterium]|nr:hypothetical protein [Candidatus Krumholzibacteria bacterium]